MPGQEMAEYILIYITFLLYVCIHTDSWNLISGKQAEVYQTNSLHGDVKKWFV